MKVSIVTPERLVWEGQAAGVYAPGWNGEFGALEGHVGYLAALRGGLVRVVSEGGEKVFAVGRGFAEIAADRVTVLVDACVSPDKVDKQKASADLASAAADLAAAGGIASALELADEKREFASARLAL